MKNDFPPCPLKILPAILLAFLPIPLHGAVTWPSVDHYTWNFNLGAGGPSSSLSDMLTIQLDSSDRLVEPERMLIHMYIGTSSEPVYSRVWNGPSFGVNGLIYSTEAWDVPMGVSEGRLELEMEIGTVELRRLTLSIGTGTTSYATSISPNVRLIPEPGVAVLITFAGGIAFQRRRKMSSQPSPPGLSQ